ncbi:hypothetical protein [Formosa haliotis]|uniref:hypothetical protein n=1 Tax=Formosa haliotis TaxID=1555194 RepID=UPI0013BEA418|nr:hypothetical protein [Formosa haliotis]
MTYLSPEIEAWSKRNDEKSLVRPGVSCGIFQDCSSNEEPKVKNNQQNNKADKTL